MFVEIGIKLEGNEVVRLFLEKYLKMHFKGKVLVISVLMFTGLIYSPLYARVPDGDIGGDTVSVRIEEKALFLDHEILEIKIFFDDLKALKRDISDKVSYHQALLALQNNDGGEQLFPMKVKTRGNFRKSPLNCNFPPLLLNFDRDELEGSIFEGQNKLKLVTHCNSADREFEQYLLQEYLVYRSYNILTEKSFRVRLAHISYIDMSDQEKTISRYGFLLEDADDMAGRNGYRRVKLDNIPLDYTDYFYQALVSVFQYMIGNTDWSVPYTHNIRLIMEKSDLRPLPVPYDFDWCGMVNPVYAVPSSKLGIESVEERLYRGYERPVEDFKRIFEVFLKHKDEFYSLYENSLLSKEQKERSLHYLDEFFAVITDDEKIISEFVEPARKYKKENYYGK